MYVIWNIQTHRKQTYFRLMQFQFKKQKSAIFALNPKEKESLLKQNIDYSIHRATRRHGHQHKNSLSECKYAINQTLKIKREEYQHSIRNSIYKLNTTISWAKEAQFHLEEIEKSQIKINSKNNAKLKIVMDKQTIKLKNEANCKDLTCPKKPKDDGFVAQNNLFCIREQSVICYQDMFPMYRLGNTLLSYDKKIYMYGGHSFKGLANSLHLHYYDLKNQTWKKIANNYGQLPYLCTCYHTAEQYKNYLIFIGGISIDSIKNRRYFNFEITLFDLQQESWSKIRWNKCLRSHASTLYGNMLMVYGGINQKDEYLNQIYFISLNMTNIQQSTIMQYTTPIKNKAGVAFHKIVNTYELQPNLRERIDLDGIISYGGKFYDGTVCSDATIFRLNFKGRENISCNKSQTEDCNGWQILSLKGRKPEGRYDHSMNILNKKGICLIVGGMNEADSILKDAWIMDLCSFSWIQAQFDSNYQILTKGIAGHSSTCDENSLYIFGGIRNFNSEANFKFFSINFAAARIGNDRTKMNISEQGSNKISYCKKFSFLPQENDRL